MVAGRNRPGGHRPVLGQPLEPLAGGPHHVCRRGILSPEELRERCLNVGIDGHIAILSTPVDRNRLLSIR